MAPGTRTEQLLRVLRKKIAAVAHMSPFLSRGFYRVDQLAREIVNSVGPDAPTTGDHLKGALESTQLDFDAMERIALLEASLTRAMEYERLELGISAPELGRLMGRKSLDFGNQVRILYFLTLSGTQAWDVLDSTRLEQPASPTLDPVCRALRTLKSGDLKRLQPMHRTAVLRARHSPLGFCRLLVEEALTILRASEVPNLAPLAYLDQLFDDPFLAVVAPPQFADIKARIKLYLAQHHAFDPHSEEALAWLQAGADLLPHGTDDPELKAVFFEAQGAVAIRAGGIEEALRSFMRANVLLAEVHLADRRAESLLQYSLALSAHSHRDSRAALVLESTLAMLAAMASELDPALRLRLLHFLALVELRRAHGHLPHPMEGFAQGFEPTPADVRRRVTDWSGEVKAVSLGRAWVHLKAARDLYADHAPPMMRLHRSWLLGQALLFEHPDLALIYLLDAQSGFEAAAHRQLAGLARRDVAACLAYLGQPDQCAIWLESLSHTPVKAPDPEQELLQDLAMLRYGMLAGEAENRDADRLLGEILAISPPMDMREVSGPSGDRGAFASAS